MTRNFGGIIKIMIMSETTVQPEIQLEEQQKQRQTAVSESYLFMGGLRVPQKSQISQDALYENGFFKAVVFLVKNCIGA